jgi:predicted Na+-dependent transporter
MWAAAGPPCRQAIWTERSPSSKMTRVSLHVPRALGAYREVLLVLVAAMVGLAVPGPLRWVVRHDAIDILLVVLVFSTALTISPEAMRRIPTVWKHVALVLAAGITLLPALSWTAGHLVEPGALRDGVVTIGLAPCEIASIATTALAGGDAALAAGILLGSTILSAITAGPILSLERPGTSVHSGHIIVTLVLVVVLPLALGVGARVWLPLPASSAPVGSVLSTVALVGLVAVIAAEIHLAFGYLSLVGAVVIIVLGSALIARAIGRRTRLPTRRAILLTTSMRDFAIAAGLASVAFGSSAAAPLGVYGVLVLIWGTGAAGYLRAHAPLD